MKFTNRKIANTILISSLLVASVASIGFSSWLIEGGGVKGDIGIINVEVGKFEDYTDCITIDESKDNGGFIPLYYCSTGFINSSTSSSNAPSVSTSGEIIFFLKMNLAATKAKLHSENIYLIPSLALEGSNGNTSNFVLPTVTVNYLKSDISATASSNSENSKWTSKHLLADFGSLSSDTGEIYLTLTYSLKASSSAAYYRIYSYLSTSSNNAKMVLYLSLGEENA